MPPNIAAILKAAQAPLEVQPCDYPTHKENEVIIRARAVAINPVDWAMQAFGPAFFPWLQLPGPIGGDVAGQVEAVGSAVKDIRVGDRVAGLSAAAFQQYAVLADHMLTPIPASLSYEQACVFPLCLSTAVKGLFHKDYLAMQLPLPRGQAKPTGETVLIWGASTSVGSNAIQLAVAAGYEVITTASPANFERAKRLGASQVLDYNSPSIQEDLVAAFAGKKTPGAFANAGVDPSAHPLVVNACAAAVAATPGHKFLACTMANPPTEGLPDGLEAKFVDVLRPDTKLAYKVFREYLPGALADGSFVPEPKARVVGEGLEDIQGALETLRKGISASKLVVTL